MSGIAAQGDAPRSPNTAWEPTLVDRCERLELLGQQGATVWLTGLPASGKSTLAGSVERRLTDMRRTAYRLDGDNLRHGLNGDLGFAPSERSENVRRTAHAARLLADAGVIVVASLVSPYRSDRATARSVHEEAGIPFLEVHVATPLDVCEARDPKGLYARARRGELRQMTGVDAPYETPVAPDLVVQPAPRETQADLVVTLLDGRGLLAAPSRRMQ